MEYITSDSHFYHKNIFGKDGFEESRKDFNTAEEMNNTLIDAFNSVMTSEDTLYHLGDLGLNCKPKTILELLERINGQIVIIKGNHDSSKVLKYLNNHNYSLPNGKPKFVIHEVGTRIKKNGITYYLTHYPLNVGEQRKKIRSICGHLHSIPAPYSNSINIGVDSPEIEPYCKGFGVPLTVEQAIELVEDKWNDWKNNNSKILKD